MSEEGRIFNLGVGCEETLFSRWDEYLVVKRGNVTIWLIAPDQVGPLVEALRELGHIEPKPEPEPDPEQWRTIGIHGPPKPEPGWVWSVGSSRPVHTRSLSRWTHPDTRYLPGCPNLPDWDDIAPAPVPKPWVKVGAEPYPRPYARSDVIAAAWALKDGSVMLTQREPSPRNSRVVAWCPIYEYESIPPHPFTNGEPNPNAHS